MISNRSNVLTPGFVSETIDINGVNIHYQIGGDPNGQARAALARIPEH
jgi:hypothetical protein